MERFRPILGDTAPKGSVAPDATKKLDTYQLASVKALI